MQYAIITTKADTNERHHMQNDHKYVFNGSCIHLCAGYACQQALLNSLNLMLQSYCYLPWLVECDPF